MPVDGQSIPSVWIRPRRRREQPPPLSRDRIVAAAVELLDAEGVDALSMRRLGTRLGAGATSLYRHVANKDELIELVVDQVYGEIEVPEVVDRSSWREAAIRTARNLRAVILRHPWIVTLLGEAGLAYLGPNMMRLSEGILAMFETAGLTLHEADHALNTLVAYVTGTTTSEAAWLTTVARSGQNERDWAVRLWPAAEEAAQAYPRMRKLYAAQRDGGWKNVREDNFDWRLGRVLDGLESWIARTDR